MTLPPRMPRYSLRLLLVAVAICALPMAWFAKVERDHDIEREALGELEELAYGDYIAVSTKMPDFLCGTGLGGIALTESQSPAWLQRMAELLRLPSAQRVVSLELYAEDLHDDAVAPILRLRHLRTIELQNTSISPQGVERLKSAFPDCEIVAPIDNRNGFAATQ